MHGVVMPGVRCRKPISGLCLAAILAAACSSTAPRIEQTDVERVIGTLAADAMQGRRAFEPGSVAAAQFLTDEFEAIGLQPLAGETGLQQHFPVYSMQVQECSVTLEGTDLPADDVVCALAAETLAWNNGDATRVVRVAADGDPRAALVEARRSGVDTLLLLSAQHAPLFRRMRPFLAGGAGALDPPSGASLVIALTDREAATSFQVEATATSLERGLANVVGVIPGRRADEMVLFSGHYDHLGVREGEDDVIANGANDDASGTTAVVELARYFAALPQPERTLVFVAFTAEEIGGYGSSYLARQLDPDRIVAMFNIEMIGKVASEGPHTAWITGFDASDFGSILQQAVEGTDYRFYADPYPDQNLFYRSDNATLARLGVPAHTISTTQIDIDPDYHQVTDEVATLDLEHLTDTIRAIAMAAGPIVSGEATPTRIVEMPRNRR